MAKILSAVESAKIGITLRDAVSNILQHSGLKVGGQIVVLEDVLATILHGNGLTAERAESNLALFEQNVLKNMKRLEAVEKLFNGDKNVTKADNSATE